MKSKRSGEIPASLGEKLRDAVALYRQAGFDRIHALEAAGAIIVDVESDHEKYGYGSVRAARKALGEIVRANLREGKDAASTAVRTYMSQARSAYDMTVLAPDVTSSDDYSAEVLKHLAPVANEARKEGKDPKDAVSKVAAAARKVADSKDVTFSSAIREVRQPTDRIHPNVKDYRAKVGALSRSVGKARKDGMIGAEGILLLAEVAGSVADMIDPTDYGIDPKFPTVAAFRAARTELRSALKALDNAEQSCREQDPKKGSKAA